MRLSNTNDYDAMTIIFVTRRIHPIIQFMLAIIMGSGSLTKQYDCSKKDSSHNLTNKNIHPLDVGVRLPATLQ